MPNAPVLLRAICSTCTLRFVRRKIPTGDQPNTSTRSSAATSVRQGDRASGLSLFETLDQRPQQAIDGAQNSSDQSESRNHHD